MKSLLATSQHFDSLYRRRKTGKIKEDDLFSLDDVFASMRSSTSLFNGYGFSDDEEDLHGSVNISNSLYFDDVSSDLSGREEKRTANKHKKHLLKQPASSAPSDGTLEGLFSPTAPAKTVKNIGAERSSIPSKSNEVLSFKSRSSPAISELLRSTSKTSGGISSLSNTNHKTLSGRKNYVWKADADEYETDTDEDLEFASDNKEVSALRRNTAVVKKALFIATGVEEKKTSTAPPKSSSSKTRIMDLLSLSSHRNQRQGYSEKKQRPNSVMDSLSLSEQSSGRREESSVLKSRSSSVSGPTQRQSSVRNKLYDELFECSDMPVDRKPKRCSSLSGPRQRRSSVRKELFGCSDMPVDRKPKRCSSLSVPPRSRSSVRKELFDCSDMPVNRKPKCSSSIENPSSQRLGLEDAASTPEEQRLRSSSTPKRSKKKSVDQSNHSSTGDDEKTQRSASVSRKKKRPSPVKKKKKKDVLSHSSHHSQMSSASVLVCPEAPNQRNIKKSSSATILDKMSKSEDGKRRSSKSRTKRSPKKVDTGTNPRSSKAMRSKSPLNRRKLDSLYL